MRVLVVLVLAMCIDMGFSHPHILHIVADDLGYNDVGWHDDHIKTPVLNELAHGGVILKNLYGMSACSPSRAAMFTGMYPSNIGVQHFVLAGNVPHGVPTYIPYLPTRLKEHGYKTYGVGKWHQGFCNSSYIPTAPNRGFDHYYGFYQGGAYYYEHTTSEFGPLKGTMFGYDMHDDGARADDPRDACVYNSILFQREMLSNIENHDPSVPMYQYCAFQLPHTPRVVPKKYSAMYPEILDEDRQVYYGQMSFLDEIVGNLVAKLKEKGMYDDTLIIFHADNGGDVFSGASNHPYRGDKGTFFDGGFRLAAFMAGKGIEKTGYVHEGLFHLTDIHPTLIEGVIGLELSDNLDGMNAWDALSTGADSPRTEFLITVDTDLTDHDDPFPTNVTAIRVGDYKLIVGHPAFLYAYGRDKFGWYPPLNTLKPTAIPAPEPHGTDLYLFNLKDDPYEEHNLAHEMPDKVAELREKLKPYEAKAWTFWPDTTDAADPKNFHNFWDSGWC